MEESKFYTVQIILHDIVEGTKNHETMEFEDMSWQQVEIFKTKAFTQGVQRQTAPKAWELICPLRIHRVYFFQQERKSKI